MFDVRPFDRLISVLIKLELKKYILKVRLSSNRISAIIILGY
jgi:hypothetical protein